ncbi:hypothetical protein SAMN04488063_3264 [Halopelagius inordinatus]|uniref:Uncharacterized protein n=1 Tax=Halopelagius inordinatus TaxID=553467 RepID=A0A1I2VQ18_9EURY|nr:hypothetical protein [Halopelagius inordinatus]SFG91240.1 hypothetical protein SAMN04488063_3264 [Halopelagius inordinatus]
MSDAHLEPQTAAVSWRYDVTDSRLLLACTYVLPGILGGGVLLASLFVGTLVLDALRAGDIGRAVGVLAVPVLALLVRRYVPALLDATDAFDPTDRYSLGGLAASSVVGAAAIFASLRIDPAAPFVLFAVSWIPMVLTAGLPTEGHTTPEADTLVVDGSRIPLDAVDGYRTVAVGGAGVCWLSYARGVPRAPRVVVVPRATLDSVRAVLEDAENRTEEGKSTLGGAERAVVVAFGLGLVAVGPVLWLLLPPGDGALVALYAGSLFGLFGLVLLWHAATG